MAASLVAIVLLFTDVLRIIPVALILLSWSILALWNDKNRQGNRNREES